MYLAPLKMTTVSSHDDLEGNQINLFSLSTCTYIMYVPEIEQKSMIFTLFCLGARGEHCSQISLRAKILCTSYFFFFSSSVSSSTMQRISLFGTALTASQQTLSRCTEIGGVPRSVKAMQCKRTFSFCFKVHFDFILPVTTWGEIVEHKSKIKMANFQENILSQICLQAQIKLG